LCQAIVANAVLLAAATPVKSAAAEQWCDSHIAGRDFLRLAMMAFLAEHDASFDLLVQRRKTSRRMPIDDATRRWPESLSSFQKVADIRIPRQVFWPQQGLSNTVDKATKEMMELGENMSFNPWHTIRDHEPLGTINLMRRTIYPAIVRLRNDLNRTPRVTSSVAKYEELKQLVR
jgi:hypothetical protein